MIKEKLKKILPKKTVSRVTLGILAAIILIHAAHALTLDRMVQYVEISFKSHNLPPELDGYRIAFVTDIHLADEERLWRIRDRLNKENIDLLLLGGDFFNHVDLLGYDLEILSQTETTDGIFGVEGNHDNYKYLFPAMEAVGIIPLSNSGVYVRDNFWLAGVEDLWNRNPDISQAKTGVAADSFILLLSHNPDVSMIQDTTNIDLILSGHTHGGQMNFFGLWSFGLDMRVISEYGSRFRSGWAESHDGVPVFVSNGIGSYYPRVFARPQVILLTLFHK
ncbi:MAG: metallophosphoesterase [Oscillospiraceae bacterium]|nr:metallophosphoesterase [Oscillospiraceae bacterium]